MIWRRKGNPFRRFDRVHQVAIKDLAAEIRTGRVFVCLAPALRDHKRSSCVSERVWRDTEPEASVTAVSYEI